MKRNSDTSEEAEAAAVRAMPCLCNASLTDELVARGELTEDLESRWCSWTTLYRGVQAAHVTARGMGGTKGGRFDLVPLCAGHHAEAGEARTSQRAAFEERYGLDMRAEADRIALGHEPPLGIRGLARRWAAPKTGLWLRDDEVSCSSCEGRGHRPGEFGEGSDCSVCSGRGCVPKPLDTYELKAMLGWVRRRMAAEVAARRANPDDGDSTCCNDDGLPFADHDVLVNRVASALGFGELLTRSVALSLCETAGWPDEPMGAEQCPDDIRGLAQRWAATHGAGPEPDCEMCEGMDPVVLDGVTCWCEGCSELADHERGELLGWVRCFMERNLAAACASAGQTAGTGADGLTAWMGDVEADLAHRLTVALGYDAGLGPNSLALALCEAAGWPEVEP